MERNKIAADEVIYGLLIRIYGKLGLYEDAQRTFEEIEKLGLLSNEKTYITMAQVHLYSGDLEKALKVYCKEGMVGDAEQLIEEMSTSGHFEDSKFIQTFSMVMHGQSRKPNKAEDSLERLDQPVVIAFELILTLYSATGNSIKAEEILKLLLKTANGLSIASQLVNKLIKEGEITKAECLYKLLVELGRIPEHVASASMISFYGKQQKLKQALEVFQMAAGSPTNAKPLYNSMIDAYAKSGKPEAAYLFYREASEEGQDFSSRVSLIKP